MNRNNLGYFWLDKLSPDEMAYLTSHPLCTILTPNLPPEHALWLTDRGAYTLSDRLAMSDKLPVSPPTVDYGFNVPCSFELYNRREHTIDEFGCSG